MTPHILTVDLATGQIATRPLEDPLLGGRLLTAMVVTQHVDPRADPLGPDNVLAMACGPLAGTRASTGGRLSVGAKSPLTRGIKESNAGGMAGDSLAALGYRALVLTGARPARAPAVLILDEQGPRLADGEPYRGLGNEATVDALRADYGDGYVAVTIGPAGEARLAAAGIAVTDANGRPFRLAARGGLGAIMGSKGLKAILVRRISPAAKPPEAARPAIVGFHKLVAPSPRVSTLRDYGTASTLSLAQNLGALPTRNFSAGQFEGAEAIGGEALRDLTLARGGVGTPTEACMAGCVIQCSNIFPGADGGLAVAPLEFETLGLCGSNLGLGSLDAIARINRLCNDLGLDTIEVGAALGVMMEAAEGGALPPGVDRDALPRFGDGDRAAEVVAGIAAGIAAGEPLSLLAGSGVAAVGRALGVARVPAVKGQAISAYDPRAIKGTGVTYATSPQGADHTAGLTVFAQVDHRDPGGAVALSRAVQLQRAAYDALGLCVFNLGATGGRPDVILGMLNALYGLELGPGWLEAWGRRVIETEIAFNRAAGLTAADDRLPAFFEDEPLPPTGAVWDVPDDALDGIWR
jgi:aldehyde:ferredoxin oxidoreductase